MEVQVDHRELKCKVPNILKSKGVLTNTINNQITDYVIDQNCGIERKTINDFLISIIDKRIFRQVNDLCQNFYNPLIILEGGGLYSNEIKINHNVIRGTMIWISIHKRVPIIRTFNQEDTAEILLLLTKSRQSKNHSYISLQHKRKSNTAQKQERNILESIDGIGYKLAGTLIRELKSIRGIIQASEKDLSKISGIGPGKAKYIKTIFDKS